MRQMSSLTANKTAAADLREWLRGGGGGGGGGEVPGPSSSPHHPSNGTAAEGEGRLGQKRKMEEPGAGIIIMGQALGFHIWSVQLNSIKFYREYISHPSRTCSLSNLSVCAGS